MYTTTKLIEERRHIFPRAIGRLLIALATYCLFSLLFSSCSQFEPELPGNQGGTAVNYYGFSDAISQLKTDVGNEIASSTIRIYVNEWDSAYFNSVSFQFPPTLSNFYPDGTTYWPYATSITNSTEMYQRIEAGGNTFVFEDYTQTYVKETRFAMEPQKWYTLYFADSLRAGNDTLAFSSFLAEEPREASPGKVRLRLVNLSPDAGKVQLRVKRLDDSYIDGIDIPEAAYAQASPYIEVDTTGISAYGQISLDVLDENGIVIAASGADINPSGNFHIVLLGYRNQTSVVMNYKILPSGAMLYRKTTITPNLRVAARRMY